MACFFRWACYHDQNLSQGPLNENKGVADFVIIKLINGNLSASMSVDKRVHSQPSAWLQQSLGYKENLADFLKNVQYADLPELTFNKRRDLSPFVHGTYVYCSRGGYC
jgi:hypothetical protein